jgi:hypothetical protein
MLLVRSKLVKCASTVKAIPDVRIGGKISKKTKDQSPVLSFRCDYKNRRVRVDDGALHCLISSEVHDSKIEICDD